MTISDDERHPGSHRRGGLDHLVHHAQLPFPRELGGEDTSSYRAAFEALQQFQRLGGVVDAELGEKPAAGQSTATEATAEQPADGLASTGKPTAGQPDVSQSAPVQPAAGQRPEMPHGLRAHIADLEAWAVANKHDARTDSLAFWALKIPAILASASAGILAYFSLTSVSVIAGAAASLCVIIDGIHPRGMLRNTHLRASHDVRALIFGMVADWRAKARGLPADAELAGQLISGAQPEVERIRKYVRDAETALNPEGA